MVYKGYPESGGGDTTAEYVLTQAASSLVNGKLLTPGPGIAIVVASGLVTISTAVDYTPNDLTMITRVDERVDLPNSVRLVQGSNVTLNYNAGAGTLAISSSAGGGAGLETYFTVNTEPGLVNARRLLFGNNLATSDGGAGLDYTSNVAATSIDTAGTYNLTGSSKQVRFADASSGDVVYNLPASSSNGDKLFTIKRIDNSGNNVTINRAGGDTIDGQTAISLIQQYEAHNVQADGSGHWYRY